MFHPLKVGAGRAAIRTPRALTRPGPPATVERSGLRDKMAEGDASAERSKDCGREEDPAVSPGLRELL
jgi:hypothetical protein